MATAGGRLPRKRILIVNCYLDDSRAAVGRPRKVPHAMGPVYLAAACAPHACDVRLYNEAAHGPLADEALLGWADMLVLTGLTTALDRMRQLTAYARTQNPRVVVVAGGHAVRALPRFCATQFDYCCAGDVEELADVLADAFGRGYVAERGEPRFDLCDWLPSIGYLESSRYCNFHCRFCTLTAERRPYSGYDLDAVRRDLLALGRRRTVIFIDNNFYGPDRSFFVARMELLRELRRAGQFGEWTALVTNDFFFDERNLPLARDAGCIGLFSGVESFDVSWLQRFDKRQNAVRAQRDIIRNTLAAGIVFVYGLVLDPTTRRLDDLWDELAGIVDDPSITLPAYCSVTIPLLGTPFFYDCLDAGRLLPSTRVRDLDGTTVSLRPLDPLPDVAAFVRAVQSFDGLRAGVLRHTVGFLGRYARTLGPYQVAIAAAQAGLLCTAGVVTATTGWGRGPKRTHVSTTEVLDAQYRPALPVASRWASLFAPVMLTDAGGAIATAIAEDVSAARPIPQEESRHVAAGS